MPISDFEGDFNTKTFIEEIASTVSDWTDTDDLLDAFEKSLQDVLKQRKTVRIKELDLRENYENNRQSHLKNVENTMILYRNVSDSCETLEKRIGSVGHVAVRIGDQLETLDKQLERSRDLKELVEIYLALEKDDAFLLDKKKLSGKANAEKESAALYRRLASFALQIDPGKIKDKLNKYCESYERNALEDFENAYRLGNLNRMAILSESLTEFNGGTSCIQAYVNQHSFFLDQMENLPTENRFFNDGKKGEIAIDVDGQPDSDLVSLYEGIINMCRGEYQLIHTVFPKPLMVYEYFLRRTFEQLVQSYLDVMFRFAENHSNVAYLQTLHTSYEMSKQLINDLVLLFDRLSIIESQKESKDINGNLGYLSAKGKSSIVYRFMEEVFVPYLEAEKYLEKEKQTLLEVISLLLGFITKTDSNAPVTSAAIVQRRPNNNNSASAALQSSGSRGNLLVVPAEASYYTISTGQLYFQNAPDPLISTDIVAKILLYVENALNRMADLVPADAISRLSYEYWSLFFKEFCQKYLNNMFESIMNALNGIVESNSPQETNGKTFANVENARKIVFMIQSHFEVCVFPKISGNHNLVKDLTATKAKWFKIIEQRCNDSIQRQIDVILLYLNSILARQKKSDYKQKDEAAALMTPATETCLQCVDYLGKMQKKLRESFSGPGSQVYEIVQSEILCSFHLMLLDHLKKYQVSETGAILLSKDFGKYLNLCKDFQVYARVGPLFEMLRELGTLYLVRLEHLNSVISQGQLSRLQYKSLLPYIMNRIDYKPGTLNENISPQQQQHSAATTISSPGKA